MQGCGKVQRILISESKKYFETKFFQTCEIVKLTSLILVDFTFYALFAVMLPKAHLTRKKAYKL